jgi:hypothetical protein
VHESAAVAEGIAPRANEANENRRQSPRRLAGTAVYIAIL